MKNPEIYTYCHRKESEMTPLIIQKSEIIQNKQKKENHIRLFDDNFCGKFELNQTDGQIANILSKEIIVKNNNEEYNFDQIIKNLAYPNDKCNYKDKEKIQTYVNLYIALNDDN